MPIISILILATFVLIAGRGMGVGAKRQAAQPAIPQAPAAPTFGTTTRVSVASDGTQGDYASYYPSISADGRYVAFESYASNLAIETRCVLPVCRSYTKISLLLLVSPLTRLLA